MAAAIGPDRKLASDVRRLALAEIKRILEIPAIERSDREDKLYQQIIVKLSGSVLPRLTEVTGEDGGPVKTEITGINYIVPNGTDHKANGETAPGLGSVTGPAS